MGFAIGQQVRLRALQAVQVQVDAPAGGGGRGVRRQRGQRGPQRRGLLVRPEQRVARQRQVRQERRRPLQRVLRGPRHKFITGGF